MVHSCVLALLLGPILWAASPLRVVAVERPGLPPYEGSERFYRLEGIGSQILRIGDMLILKREGEQRSLGQLEILAVHLDHAKARLAVRGETFPLKGDWAVRTALLQPLPEVPQARPIAVLEEFRPRVTQRSLPGNVHREPIYFLKGDASLSPGAFAKLRIWVEAWGPRGQWSLECPGETMSMLLVERTLAIQAELRKLGVERCEVRLVSPEIPERYDPVFIRQESW